MQILESTWRNVQNTDFTKICIRIHFRSSIFRIWCKPLVLFWNLPVTHVSIKIVRNLLTDCRFQIPAQADSSLDGNLRFGRVLLQADSRFRVPKRGQILEKKVISPLVHMKRRASYGTSFTHHMLSLVWSSPCRVLCNTCERCVPCLLHWALSSCWAPVPSSLITVNLLV